MDTALVTPSAVFIGARAHTSSTLVHHMQGGGTYVRPAADVSGLSADSSLTLPEAAAYLRSMQCHALYTAHFNSNREYPLECDAEALPLPFPARTVNALRGLLDAARAQDEPLSSNAKRCEVSTQSGSGEFRQRRSLRAARLLSSLPQDRSARPMIRVPMTTKQRLGRVMAACKAMPPAAQRTCRSWPRASCDQTRT